MRKILFILMFLTCMSGYAQETGPAENKHFAPGIQAIEEHRWNDALAYFEKAVEADPHSAPAWFHLCIVRRAMGEPDKALAAVNQSLRFLTAEQNIDRSMSYFLRSLLHSDRNEIELATAYLLCAYETHPTATLAHVVSEHFTTLGDFQRALNYLDAAIAADSTQSVYILEKADLLYEVGLPRQAIDVAGQFINLTPDYFGGYYRRGYFKENFGDMEGAINDYTLSIALQPDYANAYLGRADMYRRKGMKALAEADYRKVIELDTIPNSNACAEFAYWELGQKQKAIDFLNAVIKENPDDAGNYYDAACLYARMGDTDTSLDYLHTAIAKGFRNFAHIELDDDLKEVRRQPRYMPLMQRYKE